MAIGAVASKAIPYLGKHFWKWIIPAMLVGQEGLSQYGKAGERGIAREEIALQKLMGEASAEATKKVTKESQKRAKEYTEMLLKEKRRESEAAREQELMSQFQASQDRQMALILQAVQAMSQGAGVSQANTGGGGGMLGLVRSNL